MRSSSSSNAMCTVRLLRTRCLPFPETDRHDRVRHHDCRPTDRISVAHRTSLILFGSDFRFDGRDLDILVGLDKVHNLRNSAHECDTELFAAGVYAEVRLMRFRSFGATMHGSRAPTLGERKPPNTNVCVFAHRILHSVTERANAAIAERLTSGPVGVAIVAR
jgi:hypothetical protein